MRILFTQLCVDANETEIVREWEKPCHEGLDSRSRLFANIWRRFVAISLSHFARTKFAAFTHGLQSAQVKSIFCRELAACSAGVRLRGFKWSLIKICCRHFLASCCSDGIERCKNKSEMGRKKFLHIFYIKPFASFTIVWIYWLCLVCLLFFRAVSAETPFYENQLYKQRDYMGWRTKERWRVEFTRIAFCWS